MSLYIGIALNDELTDIAVNGDCQQDSVPTAVCKVKGQDSWLVGEEAYQTALKGKGSLVDKLAALLRKEGTATIEGKCYSAEELLGHFFRELLHQQLEALVAESTDTDAMNAASASDKAAAENTTEAATDEASTEKIPVLADITTLVLSVRNPEPKLLDCLKKVLQDLGIPKVYVISHTECFVHFVLHQDRNLYNRTVGMFELGNQSLHYYELVVSRGSRRYVRAGAEAREEAFNLDILNSPAGEKIADRILTSLAERNLEGKSYSAVLLSGKGFESTEFAPDFMHTICQRRRVCIEPRLIAIGAALRARDIAEEKPDEYIILCDTRVLCDVSVEARKNEHEEHLLLAKAGEEWADKKRSAELILDGQNYVDFQVTALAGQKRPLQFRMLLEGFPERENRTTRIRIETAFLAQEKLQIVVRDEGFGDLFPKTDAMVSEVLDLREAAGGKS